MATQRPIKALGLDYVRHFTSAFQEGSKLDCFQREILCEDVQFPAALVSPRPSDLLAGKRIYPEVGYSLQYGGLGYYIDSWAWEAAINAGDYSARELAEWAVLREFWEKEAMAVRCYREFAPEIHRRLPEKYDRPESLGLPALPLFRMAGLQLDFGKLVSHGIAGLEQMVQSLRANPPDERADGFYACALASLDRLRRCVRHYHDEAQKLEAAAPGGTASEMRKALAGLLEHAPATFHEALQLILLVSTMTGTLNFGRLDVVLGPYLCRDLDTGRLTWAGALRLMQNFYSILDEEILHFDGRIIVGGQGRENEADADRFAMLAMETTESLSLPLPQLTLRFYSGQNPALLEKGYDVICKGKTFPMLYNDDVNVPAVAKAFAIDQETAREYLPFGCGEYMIYHRSCGTPNAIINLQRCLESALNHGRCLCTGRIIGPDFGDLNDYTTFDALWSAFTRTTEFFLEPLAMAQDSIYRTLGPECPYSLVSLLYDDCLVRGRSIFDGGIRFLGGTNETYGNNNAADSLTAIEQLVYQEKICKAEELLSALKEDWNGHELLRRRFKNAPKFGNDDAVADAMVQRVHNHICKGTSAAARNTNLHHFLVVVINNNHNTLWGKWTSASADGRKHGDPLAPGNSASAGCDRNGLSAVLNSQAKPDPSIHAGAVQNVRLTSSFPSQHRPLYHTLLNTYFQQGGTQAMITVTNRDDLLDALAHPENYANLIVRVGGFSARFIDLDPATQQEILSRTEHTT
ncbi:MAG: pyruvate formate lyase family protein [Methylacidiphilales bacterium]|nr:pyruvate formate lyase family protein [Candidatus Methylacidiphilales bacterium]